MGGRRRPKATHEPIDTSGWITPENPTGAYTHLVRTSLGLQFSIHRNPTDAQHWADKINGTVEPYVPVMSDYWSTGEPRYDH